MTPIVLGVAWLVSLGAVFILGILSAFAFHQDPGRGVPAYADPADREVAFALETLLGEPADLAALKSISARDAFPEQLKRALDSLAGMTSGVRRDFLLQALVRGLPIRPVVASVQHLVEAPLSAGHRAVLDGLLSRWGELDGRSAVAFAAGRGEEGGSRDHVKTVLSGWARVTAADAWAWVMRQDFNSSTKTEWLAAVLVSEATADPLSAMQRIRALESPELQEPVMRTMIDWMIDQMGGDRAVSLLSELDPNGLPLSLIAYFTRRWVESQPWEAVQWASQLDPEARGEIYQTVAATWSTRDPLASANWAYSLPDGQERGGLLRDIVDHWVRLEGLAEPTDWLSHQAAHRDLDGAIEAIVVALVDIDAETAFNWALSISDARRRSNAALAVGRYWIEEDIDEALPVLLLELPEEDVRSLVGNLGRPSDRPAQTVGVEGGWEEAGEDSLERERNAHDVESYDEELELELVPQGAASY